MRSLLVYVSNMVTMHESSASVSSEASEAFSGEFSQQQITSTEMSNIFTDT